MLGFFKSAKRAFPELFILSHSCLHKSFEWLYFEFMNYRNNEKRRLLNWRNARPEASSCSFNSQRGQTWVKTKSEMSNWVGFLLKSNVSLQLAAKASGPETIKADFYINYGKTFVAFSIFIDQIKRNYFNGEYKNSTRGIQSKVIWWISPNINQSADWSISKIDIQNE